MMTRIRMYIYDSYGNTNLVNKKRGRPGGSWAVGLRLMLAKDNLSLTAESPMVELNCGGKGLGAWFKLSRSFLGRWEKAFPESEKVSATACHHPCRWAHLHGIVTGQGECKQGLGIRALLTWYHTLYIMSITFTHSYLVRNELISHRKLNHSSTSSSVK